VQHFDYRLNQRISQGNFSKFLSRISFKNSSFADLTESEIFRPSVGFFVENFDLETEVKIVKFTIFYT